MGLTQLSSKVLSYISPNQAQFVHKEALSKIVNVLVEFVESSKSGPVSWVINAAPGSGKTTALRLLLKFLSDQTPRRLAVPVLVALRYSDQIRELETALNSHRFNSCIAIDHKNVQENLAGLDTYQFVIITHSRLKALAINPDKFALYKSWRPLNSIGEVELQKDRIVIIDEMPEMAEGVIFDVGSLNNAVGWFDKLAAESPSISIEDRNYARCLIALLIAKELAKNETNRNKPLIAWIDQEEAEFLLKILDQLPITGMDTESLRRFSWFKRLLTTDGLARLYAGNEGRKLLAASKVDYRQLGAPILIMDGTAHITQSLYADYDFKRVCNFHDYRRLYLWWRQIKTSADVRRNESKGTHATIAADIESLRQNGIDPFPIPAKSDIKTYREKRIITGQHQECFEDGSDNSTFEFHSRNLAGSNRLQEQKSLYLTSLPIMPPDAYRLMAFAYYGFDVTLDMASREQDGWFADPKVETLYCEWVTAEVVQLMHRSALRNLLNNQEIHIYMAHNMEWIMDWLKEKLALPRSNIRARRLFNPVSAGFSEKLRVHCENVRSYFDRLDHFGAEVAIRAISPQFREFLSHYDDKETQMAIVHKTLEEHGIAIQKYPNGRWMARSTTTLEFS